MGIEIPRRGKGRGGGSKCGAEENEASERMRMGWGGEGSGWRK